MNRKILMSLGVLVFVVALSLGVTGAFFSDTETSTGNTFTAGDIDLQIDNESYVTDSTGTLVASPETSWELKDLVPGVDHFFDFDDLKPGDVGEDTISIHVGSNDAWMCAAAQVTVDSDETCTDPEQTDETGNCVVETDGTNGDLASQLNFMFWHDDGDNVLEEGETPFLGGPLSNIGSAGQITLADSVSSILGQNIPIPGGTTFYIGKAWCFGALTASTTAQDRQGKLPGSTNGPLVRGTGVSCDGAPLNNISQTDKVQGDLQFYATQSRNNSAFTCSQNYTPTWPEEQRPLVGALSSLYNDPAPETCTFTVGAVVAGPITHTTIQAAIIAAVDGNTVCVDSTYAGTDTFPVDVDKDLTIAGLGAMGDANVPGGFFISDSGVIVTGLEFTGFSTIQASANAAIYIHNEIGVSGVALANTLIDHNIFTAPAGAKIASLGGAKAIITEISNAVAPQATDIDVTHNIINGWRQGIFFNTTDEYDVSFNDIINNDVGVANDGPHNGSIHNNDFESNVLEAVGVAPDAANGTGNNGNLDVNTNNFAPAGAGNDVNWYGTSVAVGEDVNAENNWWSGEADAARTNSTAEVDTNPFEVAAFPEN